MSKDIDLQNLLPEERDVIMRELLMKQLTSKEDLKHWLLTFLNVDLADCTVSRFSDSNPLEMVWEIYNFCSNKKAEEPLSIMYVAGRASQKTLSSAVLQVLLPLHFKRAVVHFGGTKDQARRAYTYFKKFVQMPYVRDFLKDDPTQQKTVFNISNEDIEIEILSISTMAVQGSHSPVVSLDELASLSPDKMLAYQDIAGIPTYTNEGLPWVKFGISSRKGRYTIIETEYENREKSGMVFRFWTVLENTKRCPDDISGIVPVSYYVNARENISLSEKDYNKLNEAEKTKFEIVNAFKGCFSCPLSAICAGDAKKQTSTCRTLRPIKSVIQEFKQSDFQWFMSQKMSMTPSAEGLVYPKFKREVFEKTPREIYNLFFGKDPGLDITEDALIDEMVKAGAKRYAGVDHGYTHPFSIAIVFEDSLGNCFIMKIHEESGLEPTDVVNLVQKLKMKYQFNVVYPDTAAPAINKMLTKVVRVGDEFTKVPEQGISLIRSKLSPTFGQPKLYGLKGNVDPLVSNFEKYHFAYDSSGKLSDKPVKEFDDSHDALSYAAQNRWSTGKPILGANNMPEPIDPLNPPKEPQSEYADKVRKQYSDWMNKEIRDLAKDSPTGSGVKSSKNKTNFWDID